LKPSVRTAAVLLLVAFAAASLTGLVVGCSSKSKVKPEDLPPLTNPGAPTYKTDGRPVVLEFSATW